MKPFIVLLLLSAISGNLLAQTSTLAEYDIHTQQKLAIQYADTFDNQYLHDLEQRYHLRDLVKDCKDQASIALTICYWVHKQWRHDGSNLPSKSDALSILDEAKQGKQFRCVEYGITIAAALNALGIKSRTLGLKMRGVDTINVGAGHVVTEAWLSDLKKWVMVDGQFDVIPYSNNVPLNAYELQQAIYTNPQGITVKTISQDYAASGYINWIKPYLYFFDIETDNREQYGLEKRIKRQGIMLAPTHEACPAVFQKTTPMNYQCTHAVKAFYAPAL
ncbi:MAG: transglutaminase-like domain-containing protein [Chitinophagaceae bacterium]